MTCFVSLCGIGASHANANTFDFSYQLGDQTFGVSASGVLTTSDTEVNGAYAITGITGERTIFFSSGNDNWSATQAITGLLAPDIAYGANNLLYVDSPYLDDSGFTYTLEGGKGGDDFGGNVNFSYYNGAYQEPLEGIARQGSFTLTPESDAPEPASLGLISGALMIGLTLRYRTRMKKQSSAA